MPFDAMQKPEESAVLKLLRRGYERLKNPQNWCKGKLARRIFLDDRYVVQFCMLGALSCDDTGDDLAMPLKTVQGATKELEITLIGGNKNIHVASVAAFNDAHRTTHGDVLSAYRRTINRVAGREMMSTAQ